MDTEKYHIYAVDSEPATSTVAAFVKERKRQMKRRNAWVKAQGAESTIVGGEKMLGLLAPKNAKMVKGWKVRKGRGWDFPPNVSYVPDCRTKLGKQLDKDMRDMSVGGSASLAKALGATYSTIAVSEGALRLLSSYAFQEGPHTFLIVPKNGKKPAPSFPGCRLLKVSEFYAMKESAAA